MVNYCVVPGCKTNRPNHESLSVFKVPKNEIKREEWRVLVGVEKLELQHRVSLKHFESEKVIQFIERFDENGTLIYKVIIYR